MSRSDYDYECSGWDLIRYRGAVNSAIKGNRGQKFFKELLAALDELSEKRLIVGDLESNGEYCTIGVIGKKRNINMEKIDAYDFDGLSEIFGIPKSLVREIEFMNDEFYDYCTPESRFVRMREWIDVNIKNSMVNN